MIGGISNEVVSQPIGSVWIDGERLLYVDYFGKTRVIRGVRRGVSTNIPGEIYIISGQLRWISSGTAPNYEMAVTGTCTY